WSPVWNRDGVLLRWRLAASRRDDLELELATTYRLAVVAHYQQRQHPGRRRAEQAQWLRARVAALPRLHGTCWRQPWRRAAKRHGHDNRQGGDADRGKVVT